MRDLLKATKDRVLEAYEHQNTTYGTLVRKLALPRDPSRLPLMEVQFNVEKVGSGLALEGLRVSADPNPKKYANSDIFLNVIEGPDGLVLDCDFKTELFSKATIRRWLGHFETLLEGLAGDPDARVDELPLLTTQERDDALAAWNDTSVAWPGPYTIHELIEKQAGATPDAPAVVAGAETLSYRELLARADRLASHLAARGAGAGSLVALCLERSPRHGRRAARDPEDRFGVRAPRPGFPEGAPRAHSRGRRPGPPRHVLGRSPASCPRTAPRSCASTPTRRRSPRLRPRGSGRTRRRRTSRTSSSPRARRAARKASPFRTAPS